MNIETKKQVYDAYVHEGLWEAKSITPSKTKARAAIVQASVRVKNGRTTYMRTATITVAEYYSRAIH